MVLRVHVLVFAEDYELNMCVLGKWIWKDLGNLWKSGFAGETVNANGFCGRPKIFSFDQLTLDPRTYGISPIETLRKPDQTRAQ